MDSNKCNFCGINFKVLSQRKFFCSINCRYRYMGIKKTIKECLQCKKQFEFYKSIKASGDAKFCNIFCRRLWNKDPQNKIINLKKSFDSNVVKIDNDCWGWKGIFFKAGYGQMWFMGKQINASRVSWIIHNGSIPNKLWVLHKCDNPPCTNPDHLFLGTCSDNVKDMIKKGRKKISMGIDKKNSKLNNEKVIEIRKLIEQKTPYKEISQKFSISIASISGIKYNRSWKHVT